MTMKRRSYIWPAVFVLCVAAAAQAQVDTQPFRRQLQQIERETQALIQRQVPPEQRALVDYGGFVSFNFLAIDDAVQETHILRQTLVTGYALVNIDGVHEFFIRGSSRYDDFNDGDAFDTHGDDWIEPTLDRGVYRFDLKRYYEVNEGQTINGNLVIEGGRQLVHWANGLVLSEEIDGGQVTVEIDRLAITALAGRTRTSNVDIDSSRPEFAGDMRRGFYGGMLSYQATPRHRPFVYVFVQEDENNNKPLLTDVAGTPADLTDDVITEFEYDSHYIGFGSEGSFGDRLSYGVEVVYQGGEGLSNSIASTGDQLVQTHEDIEAYAADFRLDYLFADANRTRLSGEVLIASGDSDRMTTTNTFGGNKSGTDDQAFNAFGLINAGLAFNPNVSNLLMFRAGASTFPLPNCPLFRRFQVGTNVFVFNKMNTSGPTDEEIIGSERTNDRFLGYETDFYVNWQLTSDLAWTFRYGVFFPGTGVPGDSDPRHFGFTGITFAF